MLSFVSFLAFIAVCSADLVRMEQSVNQFSSSNWIFENTIIENTIIKAIFVLKHDESALKSFEENLLDISSPKSKNYGKWLKPEEIAKWISPSDEKVKAVVDYIASFGKYKCNFDCYFF
jgi:subtilase family serine protease